MTLAAIIFHLSITISQDGVCLVWGPICPTTYWKPSVCHQINQDDDSDDDFDDNYGDFDDNYDGFDDNDGDFDANDDDYDDNDDDDYDRFRHPRPIDSWEGVKETKQLPNSCIQVRS